MKTPDLILLHGGGGHARVVIDALRSKSTGVAAIFDPRKTGEILGIPCLGAYDPNYLPEAKVIVAIGDNYTRQMAVKNTRHLFATAIHQSVVLSPEVRVGDGSMVLHGAILQTGCKVGQHVIVNTGVRIDHDCFIDDFSHIAPGAVLCGSVSVGRGTLVGAGSVTIPGIKIGAGCIVGAGSVVLENIPDYSVAVGNPARVIKSAPPVW